MKKITSIFFVAILYGCGSSVSPVDQGLIDQVMHIGNGSEPQGLDPHIVTGVPEHNLLITMCEGLTISNPEGGDNLPGMAESWEISEDGKTYIFKHYDIRPSTILSKLDKKRWVEELNNKFTLIRDLK